MSFFKRRQEQKERDQRYAKAARVKSNDTEAARYAGGNVYSLDDIEMLEREKLQSWRRKKT